MEQQYQSNVANYDHFNSKAMNYPSAKVESIKQGELVKRKPDAKKTYLRGEYNRESKKYSLTDYNDISTEFQVKKGTILFTDWDTTNEN